MLDYILLPEAPFNVVGRNRLPQIRQPETDPTACVRVDVTGGYSVVADAGAVPIGRAAMIRA
ncbi:MAG: hypothetical protein J2P16_05220, partial [Mycobacterium sp.]|nr:hypothetical protein [Mycobacterium sp.]